MSKIVFYHGATHCPKCVQMKPIARLLANEAGATFVEVDVDVQQPILPAISGIPTVVVYDTDVSDSEPVSILQPNMVTKANLRKALM